MRLRKLKRFGSNKSGYDLVELSLMGGFLGMILALVISHVANVAKGISNKITGHLIPGIVAISKDLFSVEPTVIRSTILVLMVASLGAIIWYRNSKRSTKKFYDL
jgi:hypothetical protein